MLKEERQNLNSTKVAQLQVNNPSVQYHNVLRRNWVSFTCIKAKVVNVLSEPQL